MKCTVFKYVLQPKIDIIRCDIICISGHVCHSHFFEICTYGNSHMPNLSHLKWNHGIMESRNHGIMESWNHGFLESWNHGIICRNHL